MTLLIYQSFHDEEGKLNLDSEFIPYNNMNNLTPHLREYPMQKELFWKHKDSNDIWGLVSWRWKQKTSLHPIEFKEWIESNPGYNVYHIDPSLDVVLDYKNLWIQGDRWHPGILNFGQKLLSKLKIDLDLNNLIYKSDDYTTTSFHIGDNKFWTEWYLFLDNILVMCSHDKEMYNFLYNETSIHNDLPVPNFIFVVERLLTIFLMTRKDIKVAKFPVNHRCFYQRYGEKHESYIKRYNERN